MLGLDPVAADDAVELSAVSSSLAVGWCAFCFGLLASSGSLSAASAVATLVVRLPSFLGSLLRFLFWSVLLAGDAGRSLSASFSLSETVVSLGRPIGSSASLLVWCLCLSSGMVSAMGGGSSAALVEGIAALFCCLV